MTKAAPDLSAARSRIQAIYSPELLETASQTLSELLTNHAHSLQLETTNVLNWAHPADNFKAALQQLNQAPGKNAGELDIPQTVAAFRQLA